MQKDWTEKYRPCSLSEVVGNDTAVRAMRRWAESWSKGAPKIRALVLRGEPGIGKTSSAHALAADFGWDIVEMNASDHRNAESIRRVAGAGSRAQTFTLDGDFLSSGEGKRKLIVIDEADNLFGREDYGGAKAIVETIKESQQPIILIVNDYYELTRRASAVKRLASSVIFRRLDHRSMTGVLSAIASKENIQVSDDVLDRIAENAGGDMRAAINDLQMLIEGRSTLDLEAASALSRRNQAKELGAAMRAMFGSSTVKGAADATLDLDETPEDLEKWIEESVPREFPDPGDMARAFDALSRSDIYLRRTRVLQHYGLWAYARTLMTGGMAVARRSGKRPYVSEYRFPSYFIVMSRAKGARNARETLSTNLAPYMHTSVMSFNESVLPFLIPMLRKDRELLVSLACRTDLGEDAVSYVLGVNPDSAEVQEVMRAMHEIKGGDVPKEAKRTRKPRETKAITRF